MTPMLRYLICETRCQVGSSETIYTCLLMGELDMQIERDNLQRRNEELANLARDKSKKLLHAQELYDKSKRRDHLERIQHGACDAVEDTIQTSTAAGRFVDRTGNGNQKMPLPPLFHQDKSNGMQIPGQYSNGMANSGVPNGRGLGDGIWSGLSSQGSQC